MLEERGLRGVELQVDGGVGPDTAGAVVAAGATVLVAGSAVYNGRGSVADNLRDLRSACDAPAG